MVIPGGAGGMAPPVPPSRELLRYKPFVLIIGLAYLVIVMLGFFSGGADSIINDLLVCIAALTMATRAQECMGSCVLPFFLLAVVGLFYDIANVIQTLTIAGGYPAANQFLSSSCPRNLTVKTAQNATVYLQDVPGVPESCMQSTFDVLAGTKLEIGEDQCRDTNWVMRNVLILASIVVDIIATWLGYQLFKTAGPPGGGLMGGMGGPAAGPGEGPFGAGPGGGGGGGGVPPPGGPAGPGMRLSGQEMQQAGGRQERGFTPYSGVGQALGA